MLQRASKLLKASSSSESESRARARLHDKTQDAGSTFTAITTNSDDRFTVGVVNAQEAANNDHAVGTNNVTIDNAEIHYKAVTSSQSKLTTVAATLSQPYSCSSPQIGSKSIDRSLLFGIYAKVLGKLYSFIPNDWVWRPVDFALFQDLFSTALSQKTEEAVSPCIFRQIIRERDMHEMFNACLAVFLPAILSIVTGKKLLFAGMSGLWLSALGYYAYRKNSEMCAQEKRETQRQSAANAPPVRWIIKQGDQTVREFNTLRRIDESVTTPIAVSVVTCDSECLIDESLKFRRSISAGLSVSTVSSGCKSEAASCKSINSNIEQGSRTDNTDTNTHIQRSVSSGSTRVRANTLQFPSSGNGKSLWKKSPKSSPNMLDRIKTATNSDPPTTTNTTPSSHHTNTSRSMHAAKKQVRRDRRHTASNASTSSGGRRGSISAVAASTNAMKKMVAKSLRSVQSASLIGPSHNKDLFVFVPNVNTHLNTNMQTYTHRYSPARANTSATTISEPISETPFVDEEVGLGTDTADKICSTNICGTSGSQSIGLKQSIAKISNLGQTVGAQEHQPGQGAAVVFV